MATSSHNALRTPPTQSSRPQTKESPGSRRHLPFRGVLLERPVSFTLNIANPPAQAPKPVHYLQMPITSTSQLFQLAECPPVQPTRYALHPIPHILLIAA